MKISVRRRHAQTVNNGASSHKTNYIGIFSDILNPEGHQNCCIGSKVTAILQNGWILSNCRVASERVCSQTLLAFLWNIFDVAIEFMPQNN